MIKEVAEYKQYGLEELEKMAEYTAKSNLFGMNKEQTMALFLLAQAEGMHPMRAVQVYHIIQGKPSKKADAILGEFQNKGGKVTWIDYNDKKVSATFEAPGIGAPLLVEWTYEMAQKVGNTDYKSGKWKSIVEKDVWKSYPRQMLKARVISEGVRATMPDVITGMYSTEEVMDFAEPPQKAVNVTPPRSNPEPHKDAPLVVDAVERPDVTKEEAVKDIEGLLTGTDDGLALSVIEIIKKHIKDPKLWKALDDETIITIWSEAEKELVKEKI